MIHSAEATALIERFEGKRNTAYPDPATGGQPWTIGVGHTGPEVHKGLVWSNDQVAAALDSDLKRFDTGLNELLKHETSQNEYDALISFAFNLGLGNLGGSTLLKKHNAGDKTGAADQFKAWNKANKKVLPGLTLRRAAEAALYLRK